MLPTLLLGLLGSFTHCVGMCSGVALALGRGTTGWRLLTLHLGRITTYAVLGAVAGGMGYAVGAVGHIGHGMDAGQSALPPALTLWQGALALFAASIAIYMAAALLGWAPSPERVLAGVTRWWGRTVRARNKGRGGRSDSVASLFGLGMLWGLLPCGLVMTALLLAAASGSPWQGALHMFLFGLGTWVVGVTLGLISRSVEFQARWRGWLRPITAGVVLIFGVQMALRGLAAWGWMPHQHMGGLMLW